MRTRHLLAVGFILLIGGTLALAAQDRKAPDPTAGARLKLAKEGYAVASKLFTQGQADDYTRLPVWSRRILDAERDSGGDAAKAAQDHLDRMQSLEALALAKYQAARGTYAAVLDLQFEVLEAEALLAKAKAG